MRDRNIRDRERQNVWERQRHRGREIEKREKVRDRELEKDREKTLGDILLILLGNPSVMLDITSWQLQPAAPDAFSVPKNP